MKTEIGKLNQLFVKRLAPHGAYLDGGEAGEILLPKKYCPPTLKAEEAVTVFIYYDSEDRLVATTETPLVQAGEFAFLKVVEVGKFGAFLDWGLPKHLLVPFREQKGKMYVGKKYVVYVYSDPRNGRLVGSCRVEKFLDQSPPSYQSGQSVNLLIYKKTPLGYSAIIENAHLGMIFNEDIHQPVRVGEQRTGYIKKVREDGKIDLRLNKTGREQTRLVAGMIEKYLENHQGYLPLTDDSSPEEISRYLGVSKKAFKRAVGYLYSAGKIKMETRGIRRVIK